MARRSVSEELEYPLLEQVEMETAPEPVRRPKNIRQPAGTARRRTINLFYWALPFLALAAAFLLTIAFHRVEAWLINDPRFHLPPAAGYGKDPANLQMDGVRRSSKAAILRVLEQDFGRSLYLFPVAERRRQLLAVDWVREATVSRRWPDRLAVLIQEREPVAFVQINRQGNAPQFHLIDAEGVLLPLPRGERFNFAVLTGISASEPEASRKVRVQAAMTLLGGIGPLAARISEIDVRDPGNLKAALQVDRDMVTVLLGNRNFRARIEKFLAHYQEIHQRRPGARTFDLQIDDRITSLEGADGGES